jgi:hypothetical protein
MDINEIAKLLKIETCGDDEVTVKLGFMVLARIVESENGYWFLDGGHKGIGPFSSGCFATKEEAFAKVVEWFKDDA